MAYHRLTRELERARQRELEGEHLNRACFVLILLYSKPNISASNGPNFKINSFEIYMTSAIQNCPYFSILANQELRYWVQNTPGFRQNRPFLSVHPLDRARESWRELDRARESQRELENARGSQGELERARKQIWNYLDNLYTDKQTNRRTDGRTDITSS